MTFNIICAGIALAVMVFLIITYVVDDAAARRKERR